MFDYLIVGAGFAGAVLAERLAKKSNKKVLIIDKRKHIGGNAYDYYNESGILIHKYGPHIFHTNSPKVFAYLSEFTLWRPYEHKVLASVRNKLLPIPINLNTVNGLYGHNFDSAQLAAYFDQIKEPIETIRTSEDVVLSQVGRDLYETFFRGYTRKQWGMDPSELDKMVTSRIPTRIDCDDRYFTDTFQYMPLHGYTRMFENMLDHPNIHIALNTSYTEIKKYVGFKNLIFTGPVDEYFDYCYGHLPYRSLQFVHKTVDQAQFQSVAVVNYPNDQDYTRITEYKHLTGQEHAKTSITYEYPSWNGDPYYPVPKPENAALYQQYKLLTETLPNVHFVGRLGTYRYYNMDQVVAQALTLYDKLSGKKSVNEVLDPQTVKRHVPSPGVYSPNAIPAAPES
ncbi:UDP-galactopyranose mutase [Cytophagaceae bacterium DM2B3-1]|uniref:UDP-galactopyranose mutase n=1 Tax=Xanthocytophaga flava TaxID=3048013 RepID=A0ABT7CID8_9BACT|nr:UDP-galactopyranose mutase [Xanthocytophaga flavus]MDJ1493502.1 UDP-galactopyranose mutase [Xanthocytophaga flavus]